MVMFPCASGCFKSPVDKEDTNWLQNASFSSATRQCDGTSQKSQLPYAEISETPSFKPKPKKKKKKRHKGKKEAKQTEKETESVLPALRDADKIFIDDVAGLLPEFAFRIDRSRNASILAFGCLAPAHIARFRPGRAHLRACEPLACTAVPCAVGEAAPVRTRRKRYFHARGGGRAKLRRVGRGDEGSADGGFLPIEEKEGAFVAIGESEEEEEDDEKQALNRRVRENPTDVEAWIQLSQLKVKLGSGPDPERASSILERAVAANPSHVQLRLHRLEALQELWPIERQLQEWRALTFAHPNRPTVWRQFLRFMRRQGAGPSSTVTAIAASVGQACVSMRDILAGKMLSHKALPETEEGMMELFREFCEFLSSAGLSERAVGCWQLALETNLSPEEVAPEVLELFWEGVEPKVGERGARGPGAWRRQGALCGDLAQELQDRALQEESDMISGSCSSNALWLSLESCRSRLGWLPLRGEAEDPDRVVLFEDISKVALTRFSSPRLRRRLVLCCLDAFGLRHPGLSSALDCPPADLSLPPLGGEGRDQFVKELLGAAREAFPEEENWVRALDELEFDIELCSCSSSKTIKRFARPLLSRPHNRSFLPLWRRFASAEWRRGAGPSTARPIFDTALRLCPEAALADPTRPLDEIWPQVDLLVGQAELEWPIGMTSGDLEPMKRLLCSLLEQSRDPELRVTSPDLLRVCRALEGASRRVEAGLAPMEGVEAVRWHQFRLRTLFSDLCLLRFFLLLLTRAEVEFATEEAKRWLEPLPLACRVAAAHRLTAAASAFAAARFLSPTAIQRFAAATAAAAPDEQGAVELVLRVSGRSGLLAPLRITFEQMLDAAKSPATWLRVIGIEEAQQEKFPGLERRIRALFERALSSLSARNCAELWRRYLRFESNRKSLARSVFYRALQCCPFSRDVVLEGIRGLPEVVQEALDVLVEREMRLRTPMEEVELLAAQQFE